MVLCAELLSDNPCWGNVKGVCCAGHTLQLCINAALKTDLICRTIAASRQLVGHSKKSAKATTALTEKQKQQNVAEQTHPRCLDTMEFHVLDAGAPSGTEITC